MKAARHMTPLPEATLSEQGSVRYLHLDSVWIQGAMRLNKPDAIELQYVQRMMAWLLWRPSADAAAGHAVQLGLGAGAITRCCRNVLGMRVTAVEINPSVVAACRAWFRLPADGEHLKVVLADAGEWVADPANRQCAQALCVDLYDRDAAAPVLDDEGFYAACRDVLDEGGVMSVNLFGRDASFPSSAARIAAAFGDEFVWSLQPTREGNTVVVASRGMRLPEREELLARADFIESRWKLPARKWAKMIRPPA